MRRQFFAGNWKMNKTLQEAIAFMEDFKLYTKDVKDADIVIAAPYPFLSELRSVLPGNVRLAAQNVHHEEAGPYTGEVSAQMIKDLAEWVIVGHSERRIHSNEDNALINKKLTLALRYGLSAILCVGESREERKKGNTKSVVETQVRECLKSISIEDLKRVVLAYEPVWAIGTGDNATPEQAQEVHLFLRELIKDIYDPDSAQALRIIYGGSANSENASSLITMMDIDGCLPGGASLDPSEFAKIIKS